MTIRKVVCALSLTLATTTGAQSSFPRVSFDVGAGYSLFSSGQFKDIAGGSDRAKINDGLGFSGGLALRISERLAVLTKIGYLSGSARNDIPVTAENGPEPIAVLQDEYTVSSVPVSLGMAYAAPIGRTTLHAEIAGEYHIAEVVYDSPSIPLFNVPSIHAQAKKAGFGLRLAAGTEWRVAPELAFIGKVGYRHARIEGFGYEAYSLQPYDLDLSGFFLETGLRIHP